MPLQHWSHLATKAQTPLQERSLSRFPPQHPRFRCQRERNGTELSRGFWMTINSPLSMTTVTYITSNTTPRPPVPSVKLRITATRCWDWLLRFFVYILPVKNTLSSFRFRACPKTRNMLGDISFVYSTIVPLLMLLRVISGH